MYFLLFFIDLLFLTFIFIITFISKILILTFFCMACTLPVELVVGNLFPLLPPLHRPWFLLTPPTILLHSLLPPPTFATPLLATACYQTIPLPPLILSAICSIGFMFISFRIGLFRIFCAFICLFHSWGLHSIFFKGARLMLHLSLSQRQLPAPCMVFVIVLKTFKPSNCKFARFSKPL